MRAESIGDDQSMPTGAGEACCCEDRVADDRDRRVVSDERLACESSAPVEALNAYSVPLNVS